MAIQTILNCKQCGERKYEYKDNNDYEQICNSCIVKNQDQDRQVYLDRLKNLTIEERMEKIEEILYDLNLNKRLKSLESFSRGY